MQFTRVRSFLSDGTFLEQSEAEFVGKEPPKPRAQAAEGKWHIQDRVLVVEVRASSTDGEPSGEPYEELIPIMEISEKAHVTGSTAPNYDGESVWKRIRAE